MFFSYQSVQKKNEDPLVNVLTPKKSCDEQKEFDCSLAHILEAYLGVYRYVGVDVDHVFSSTTQLKSIRDWVQEILLACLLLNPI